MSEKHERKKVKAKEKKRLRAQIEKAESLERWKLCCHNKLTDWNCYCYAGCDACGITHQCSSCNKLYRPTDICHLKLQAQELL